MCLCVLFVSLKAPAPAPVLDALADSLIPQAVAEVKPKSKVSQGDTHITPEQESIEVNVNINIHS